MDGCNKYCSTKNCNNLGRDTCHTTPTKTKDCCFESVAELVVEANPKERRTLSRGGLDRDTVLADFGRVESDVARSQKAVAKIQSNVLQSLAEFKAKLKNKKLR